MVEIRGSEKIAEAVQTMVAIVIVSESTTVEGMEMMTLGVEIVTPGVEIEGKILAVAEVIQSLNSIEIADPLKVPVEVVAVVAITKENRETIIVADSSISAAS